MTRRSDRGSRLRQLLRRLWHGETGMSGGFARHAPECPSCPKIPGSGGKSSGHIRAHCTHLQCRWWQCRSCGYYGDPALYDEKNPNHGWIRNPMHPQPKGH